MRPLEHPVEVAAAADAAAREESEPGQRLNPAAEQHDEWAVARRYISIDALRRTHLTIIQPEEEPDQLLSATA